MIKNKLSIADRRKRKIEILKSFERDYPLNSDLVEKNEYLVFKLNSSGEWEKWGKIKGIRQLENMLHPNSNLNFVEKPTEKIEYDLSLYRELKTERKGEYERKIEIEKYKKPKK